MKKQYFLIFVLICLGKATCKAQCTLGISISSITHISCYGGTVSITANAATGGTPIPVITTIAGTGIMGYNGDGIAATAAELASPYGVAVDASGNIYIADQFNCRIRKVNTNDIISTVAGTGNCSFGGDGVSATSAELFEPTDVALDAYNNIYIADLNNERIRMVNTSGIINTVAGNGNRGYNGDGIIATSAELAAPVEVAVDGIGNIYIADADNNRVRVVNQAGIISTFAGTGTPGYNGDGIAATAAELASPSQGKRI